jgi:AcrR family transcriptional regulator
MGKQLETRLQIVEALNTLMQQKTLENVKVVDICNLAGISRTTFYSYFKDIFDVCIWFWDYIMEDALYQIGITVDNTVGHVRSFDGLLQHRSFFYNAFKSKAYNSAFEYGSRHVKDVLIENARRNQDFEFTREELIQIDFYNYGAANITRQWVVAGMSETPEEITHILDLCTPSFLAELLVPRNS